MFHAFFGFTVITLPASTVTIRDLDIMGTKEHWLELGLLGFRSQLSWALEFMGICSSDFEGLWGDSAEPTVEGIYPMPWAAAAASRISLCPATVHSLSFR